MKRKTIMSIYTLALKVFWFLLLFGFYSDVAAQKLYKTPSGKKYHLADCRMVKNVSSEITIKEATDLGLSACAICKPEVKSDQPLKSAKPAGKGKGVQCKGLTKAGLRCKHFTKIGNGYCFQHQPR